MREPLNLASPPMESRIRKILFSALLAVPGIFCLYSVSAQHTGEVTILDSRHYSHIFGEPRNFRVFLPQSYSDNPEKRYPVIYFFHGWSQRYFGSSDPYGDFDKGDDNGGDNIQRFVSRNEVIVVKPDGYNRSADEKYYVRPYNVSPVETYRQFPLYFPELVEHVDAHFRTIADREHRGISGLSMGGFMTFWIGGKYPHLLSAAGNFCGSPEFVVGPKDFPVEYRNLDMYNNYAGMNVRLHYGDKDFIRGYHQDLNRVWPQLIDNYGYKMFDAAHSTCGLGEMLSFIMKTFENPPAKPERWGHIDVYPHFSVWGYEVTSDRTVPGFTVLEKVDARGFRSTVREFLPDGETLSFVKLTVITPPLYEKDAAYTINDINLITQRATRRTVHSDAEGRLTIDLDGGAHEIGINKSSDLPNLSVAAAELQDMRWATHGKDIKLNITILNKGLSPAKNISATITATRPTAQVKKGEITFGEIQAGELRTGQRSITVRVDTDSIAVEKFRITLRDEKGNEWIDHIEIPFRKNVPEINDFEIADGRTLTVVDGAVSTDTLLLGKGNGDGIANPGESIVVLVRDQNKLWRTDLTIADPYVNPFGINVRKSDSWSSFDHVGGSAKYDVPLIASDCPQNHPIEFLVEYWQPEYPLHIIKQGRVKLKVKGKDTTSPMIGRVLVTGDNVLQVQIYDGAKVRDVKAKLIPVNEKLKSVEATLNDEGQAGDRIANDGMFSQKIPDQVFGIFNIILEAEDAYGNKTVHQDDGMFVLH